MKQKIISTIIVEKNVYCELSQLPLRPSQLRQRPTEDLASSKPYSPSSILGPPSPFKALHANSGPLLAGRASVGPGRVSDKAGRVSDKLGGPQMELGASQRELGKPLTELRGSQGDLGSPQMELGSLQVELGCPQRKLGGPHKVQSLPS